MGDFITFLMWVLTVLLVFVMVVGFDRQMMDKNKKRDEIMAKRKEMKDKIKNGEKQ
ncbi:hypothetical protein CIG11343_1014 [Campylobacter iguaniorum]|uniref:hypothetical protein n=1 Tax=Campylobacter iguaniorum TaxID=1244531 RepID=UPI0007C9DC9F|nr:hypothetical protein [Campylobacter iguaniorum]ANE36029.1 hypothetical protein CIG11343_1014 [Campylobacter iguaniorum]